MSLGGPYYDATNTGSGKKVYSTAISTITESGTTVTVTCTGNHNLPTGTSSASIRGVTPTGYNGNFTVTNTGATTCTYTTSSGLGNGSAQNSFFTPGFGMQLIVGENQLDGIQTGNSQIIYNYPYGRYKTGDTTPGNFGYGLRIPGTVANGSWFAYNMDISPCSAAAAASNGTGALLIADYFFTSVSGDGSHFISMFDFRLANSTQVAALCIDKNGNIGLAGKAAIPGGGNQNTPYDIGGAIPVNRWVQYAFALVNVGSSNYTLGIYQRFSGVGDPNYSANFTLVAQVTGFAGGGTQIDYAYAGLSQTGQGSGTGATCVVMSRPRVYSITSLADVTSAVNTGYVDPPAPAGLPFFINTNAAVGADTNDGVTVTTPILTNTEFNNRRLLGAFLGADSNTISTNGGGQAITINTAAAELDCSTQSLFIGTDGAYYKKASTENYIRLKGFISVPASAMTHVSGAVYSCVAGSAYDCIWQGDGTSDVPLTLVASTPTLPGTYQNTSSVLIKFIPFNSDVPTAGTNSYKLSTNVRNGNTSGDPVVFQCGHMVMIDPIDTGYTLLDYQSATPSSTNCQCIATGNASVSGNTSGGTGNYTFLGGLLATKGASNKHIASDSENTKNNITCAYQDFILGSDGVGASCFVNDPPGITGYTQYLRRLIQLPSQVVGGSSAGTYAQGANGTNSNFYICHGSTINTGDVYIDACYAPYCGVALQGSSDNNKIFNHHIINGTTVGTMNGGAGADTISNSTINWLMPGNNAISPSLTITDSILIDQTNYSSHSMNVVAGVLTIERCTLDFSAVTINSLIAGQALWNGAALTQIIFKGNVIIANGATTNNAMFDGIPSSCTITWDNNEYVGFSNSTLMMTNYHSNGNSLTFAQFKALGFDTYSKAQGVDAGFTCAVSASNTPAYARTAAATVKSNWGAFADRYTGVTYIANGQLGGIQLETTVFAARDDAGATQFLPATGEFSSSGNRLIGS